MSVISQPRTSNGILSVVNKQLQPLVLREELLYLDIMYLSLQNEVESRRVPPIGFSYEICLNGICDELKTNVLQTTNAPPASPATQLVVSWILPK